MKRNKYDIIIYKTKSGAIEFRSDIKKETIWATQAQIAGVFQIDRSVVTKHIGNVLRSKEVNKKSNVQKMHIGNSDKPVAFYSLDMILAIGYRANSAQAIKFRQWATRVLRAHIIDGFTINKSRLSKNYKAFLVAVEKVKNLMPPSSSVDTAGVLELIKMFADTWFSLDAYDKNALPKFGASQKAVRVTGEELTGALAELRRRIISRNDAGTLFGQERTAGSAGGIIGNVFQSFDGKDVYPSLEEKAAHLLYFFVKNHPFADGNKRSGAFAFIWFLNKAGLLDTSRFTPEALTALTLLVAESKPSDKDNIIGLTLMFLSR
ncbi:MAG: virulence protein RhuM/Fic/DOC family protein [Candidatus Omnitrophota bacterium]